MNDSNSVNSPFYDPGHEWRSCLNQMKQTNMLITFLWPSAAALFYTLNARLRLIHCTPRCVFSAHLQTHSAAQYWVLGHWVFLNTVLLVSLLYNMYLREGPSHSDLFFISAGRNCPCRLAWAVTVIIEEEEDGGGLSALCGLPGFSSGLMQSCSSSEFCFKRGEKNLMLQSSAFI